MHDGAFLLTTLRVRTNSRNAVTALRAKQLHASPEHWFRLRIPTEQLCFGSQVLQCDHDLPGCLPVTKGVAVTTEAGIGLLVIEELGDGVVDHLSGGSHQLAHAGLNTLGALGILTHHQRGASQRRHLFLYPPGVAQGKIGLTEQPHELGIIQGIDQVDSTIASEHGMDNRSHIGVGMNGKDNLDVFTLRCELQYSLANARQPRTKIFAPMRRHYDQLASFQLESRSEEHTSEL